MKRYVYVLWLAVSLLGVMSCSKNSDPDPVIVGTWKLDRIRTAGFVGVYATAGYNADNDPLAVFNYQDNFTVKNDKSFTGTARSSGTVFDYSGNWEFTNNTLTLKDTQGNTDTYTVDETKTPIQLLGVAVARRDSLTNPSTKKAEVVSYTIQDIYVKQ